VGLQKDSKDRILVNATSGNTIHPEKEKEIVQREEMDESKEVVAIAYAWYSYYKGENKSTGTGITERGAGEKETRTRDG
jgi:hypothetical protein